MGSSGIKTWDLLHQLFCVNMYTLAIGLVFVILDHALASQEGLNATVAGIGHLIQCPMSIWSLYIFFQGIMVMLSYSQKPDKDHYGYESIKQCEDLHNTAWWF